MPKSISTASAKQTMALGFRLAKQLKSGEVLALIGDLGSGKTTFVKGLAKGLGVKQPITSPTFVLLKVYPVTKHKAIKLFIHVDCYRVAGIELSKIGLDDYLGRPDCVVAIEWAEKIKQLPRHTHKILLAYDRRAGGRKIKFGQKSKKSSSLKISLMAVTGRK
ncbi:MAG: tRNA (adenosine(37)-N6)-threonylcarbamoyltransferase complex ATPase subunit type 1 TsaE [Patescibacteria group bacterium]